MPFDAGEFPGSGPTPRAFRRASRRAVAVWLFAVAGMIGVMTVLGGATRATGSGLSIMEWAPLSGILPPLGHAEWERLFDEYRAIPQYAALHEGFDLDGFRHIFWLEWVHRLWGRLIGLAFLVPLIWFAATGRIERRLIPRLAVLFVLGGLQGAVGWFMVKSGFFEGSTAVAADRLVVHLALGLLLFAAMLWTALSVVQPRPLGFGTQTLRWAARATAAAVALTILAGGYVAGTHAGLAYNTFPLMDGRWVPEGYAALTPFLRNLTENIAAVQFNHRLLATLTLFLATATLALGIRARLLPPMAYPLGALGLLLAVQYALGIATLLGMVPTGLAVAHQANAVLVLAATVAVLHAMRPVPAPYRARRRAQTRAARSRLNQPARDGG